MNERNMEAVEAVLARHFERTRTLTQSATSINTSELAVETQILIDALSKVGLTVGQKFRPVLPQPAAFPAPCDLL